ncbi:MAG TPA: tetraacyldisaccharide 4'-kinase [Gemmatimonadaceae bacterium]|nr:tetraacyldisaccharide 4'-kinase [Gemmatimonadaceae bacterium]
MDRVWFGTDAAARAARAALMPAERVFASVSGLRTLFYDAGWVKGSTASIPVVSVGNLTVGGTGKTPVSAWIARWLRDHGGHPAIVMRGYGDDEPAVHRMLNADVEVIVAADRYRGVEEAARRGADIAVLDDGFQHRQLNRDVDIVLVSADRWPEEVHLLPAGPWREPLSAVRRADMVIVTRKAASDADVERAHERLARVAPRVPRMSVHLEPDELIQVDGPGREPVAALHGERIVAAAAIGDPAAFVRQLAAHASGITPVVYRDHHGFKPADVARIVAAAHGSARVVCTLKDAVKLRDLWPRGGPALWYVSQRVSVERGVGGMEQLLVSALRRRDARNSPANSGPV